MSEFDFIESIRKKIRVRNKNVLIGIGDDCALIDESRNLLVTVDSAVENIHFKREWGSSRLLGRRLVRVNISDIYSKGGVPLYALLSIGIDYKKRGAFVNRYVDGVIYELERNKIQLIGGNVSSAKDDMFFDLVLIGKVERGKLKRRDGAKSGDMIAVSGKLGDAACGLNILLTNQKRRTKYSSFINSFLLPDVRSFSEYRIWNYVTSSIDISDGLIGDLSHILEKSRCGAVLWKERIPVSRALIEYCKNNRLDIYRFILAGGEDYRILVTLRRDTPAKVIEESEFSVIGMIENKSGIRISGLKNNYEPFKHF